MSDTPRTDSEVVINHGIWPVQVAGHLNAKVRADFARQLERELNEAKKKLFHAEIEAAGTAVEREANNKLISELRQCDADRDRWKAMAEELAKALNNELLEEFGFKKPCDALTKFNQLKSQTQ